MPAFGLEPGPAWIIITAIISIFWSLKVFAIRTYTRLKINGPFGHDDTMCGICTACGVIYSIIVMVQVAHGFGSHEKHPTSHQRSVVAVLAWVNGFFINCGSGFSKLSACFFISRITKTKEHLAIAYALVGACSIWTTQALLFNAFACGLPRPWIGAPENSCIDRWLQGSTNASVSYVLEIAILSTAIYIVWGSKMARRSKIQVAIAFSLRLTLMPAGISRLHIIYAVYHNDSPERYTVKLAIMSIITLHTIIIAATVPCLKPFLSAFSSGMPSRPRHYVLPTHRERRREPESHTWNRDRRFSAQALRLRPIQGQSSVTVEHVPLETLRAQRPSLAHTAHTAHTNSTTSITIMREFSVSFHSVGGVLNSPHSSPVATPKSSRTQGSGAGFPWHWSRRMSDQTASRTSDQASPEARMRGSNAGVSLARSKQSEARSSMNRDEEVTPRAPSP